MLWIILSQQWLSVITYSVQEKRYVLFTLYVTESVVAELCFLFVLSCLLSCLTVLLYSYYYYYYTTCDVVIYIPLIYCHDGIHGHYQDTYQPTTPAVYLYKYYYLLTTRLLALPSYALSSCPSCPGPVDNNSTGM